jgi:hypothetical protein
MAYTFIYTADNEGQLATIKFESRETEIIEFDVTILTDPEIKPFKIKLDNERWTIPGAVPEKIRGMEKHITEAAEKFKR